MLTLIVNFGKLEGIQGNGLAALFSSMIILCLPVANTIFALKSLRFQSEKFVGRNANRPGRSSYSV